MLNTNHPTPRTSFVTPPPCLPHPQALVAAGKPRSYDPTAALRILPCDSECEKQRASKAARTSDPDSTAAEAAAEVAAPAPDSTAAAAAAAPKPKQRLTRAEREALAEQRELERQVAERKQRLRSLLVQGLVWMVVFGLAVALVVMVLQGLSAADKRLSEQYSPELLQREL
jgi:NF-X1-type zinc finger protein NFXL1